MGWAGSAFGPGRASVSCGRICGSVGVGMAFVSGRWVGGEGGWVRKVTYRHRERLLLREMELVSCCWRLWRCRGLGSALVREVVWCFQ